MKDFETLIPLRALGMFCKRPNEPIPNLFFDDFGNNIQQCHIQCICPKRKTSYFVQFRFLSLFMVIPVQSWAERNARWSNLRRNRQMFSVVMGWITRQVIPNTLSVITHSIHVVYTHSKLHCVFKYDKFIKYTQYTTCNPKIWKKNTPCNFCKIHGVNNALFTPCKVKIILH